MNDNTEGSNNFNSTNSNNPNNSSNNDEETLYFVDIGIDVGNRFSTLEEIKNTLTEKARIAGFGIAIRDSQLEPSDRNPYCAFICS